MYISNRPRTTARRRGLSLRRLLLFIFAPIIIVVGIGLYQNREMIAPIVDRAVNDLFENGQNLVRTAQAPTAIPTQDPSNTVQLAQRAWEIGSYGESTRLYAEIIDAVPNEVTPHYRLALGLIMEGRYDEALTVAEDAVTANPFHPDAWTIQAMALNRQERYTESIASALHAIELVSLNAAAEGVNETEDSGDTAVREELKAMRARARAYLAESYTDLGNFSRGFDEVNRALEDDPDSFDALFIRGFINKNYLFEAEAGRADLQQAYAASVEMPHIGLNLALTDLFGAEGVEESVQILNDIVERNPENGQALYYLGYYWRRFGGDVTQAMTYLQRCVNADPENIDCLYELGRAQEAEENYDLARQNFERTIELGSTDPYHFYWAGALQRDNLGDCPRAVDYWERGFPLAQQLLLGEPANQVYSALIENYQTALSGCGIVVTLPTIVPEATQETGG